MIYPSIIQLKGGLGNQLFQYSMGKWLEIKHNHSVFYDSRGLHNSISPRNLDLVNFKLWETNKNKFILNGNFKYTKPLFYYYNYYKLFDKIYTDKNNLVNNSTNLPKGIYKGFWQNKKFILETILYLKKDLEPQNILTFTFPEIEYSNQETVGIHIRGGDYLKQSELVNLSSKYYNKGIQYFKSIFSNPIFIIFTDDKDYTKKILHDENFIYCKKGTDIEQFILLSKCKHQIIANSTFSWWASVINNNPNKIVVSPKLWNINTQHELKMEFMIEF